MFGSPGLPMVLWPNTKDIAPYIPVIDKSQREDGTFSREDFVYDAERDAYTCPAGKTLTTTGHVNADNGIRYVASVPVCIACPLKPNCSRSRRCSLVRHGLDSHSNPCRAPRREVAD